MLRHLTLTLLTLLALPAAHAAPRETSLASGKPQQLASPDHVPEGLAKSDWTSIRSAYEAGRHAFQPTATGWQARNPGQQWTTTFDRRGFVAAPKAGGWTWGLELQGYGFGAHQQTIAGTPAVQAEGSRLTYQWDAAVQEWFVNDQRGLEHGFTVRTRPAADTAALTAPGTPPPALSFLLAVRGELRPHVTPDALGVEFRDAAGATVLNYAGLKVWDADGKVLTSHFELADSSPAAAGTQQAVRLLVDERGARYPITIDPIAQQAFLKASNNGASTDDNFGWSVAVSGDTVVVGARWEDSSTTGVNSTPDESAPDAGAAYVFLRVGTTWTQQAYLKAHQVTANDQFGHAVAVSGDTVVVGAYGEASSTTGPTANGTANESASAAGAAYVFVRSGTTWTQQAYLKAHQVSVADYFGYSVAVSGDTVVVGAILEDSSTTGVDSTPNESASSAGAAYVFVRSGTAWTQQAYLKAHQVTAADFFGTSVAVAGHTVVVGAFGEASSTTGPTANGTPNESASGAGAAYVFVRSGTAWIQQAYLKAHQVTSGDSFGTTVALSGDTVVVGASGEDSSTTGVTVSGTPNESAADSGAAYVFVRSGTVWTQQAYLKAGNTGAGDAFGYSVAVAGGTVVVGAYAEASSSTGVNSTANELAAYAGAAYVFARSGTTWSQQAYLKASQVSASDQFGRSVAVSDNTVVVGAFGEASSTTGVTSTPNEGASYAGAAYVFVWNGTAWSQQAYLKASNTPVGVGSNDNFGYAVAVSGDTAVVGAFWEDSSTTGVNSTSDESASNAGGAYVFVRSGTTWTQQAYLKAHQVTAGDWFGCSVAVAGDTVVVGAQSEDSSTTGVTVSGTPNELASNAGAAYVFVRSGTTWTQQAYLKADQVTAGDRFGGSVAVSGDTVMVGASAEDSSTTGVASTANELASNAGAAYVFVRSGTTWTQQAYLKAGNTEAGDAFGNSVVVSGDTVVVGAISEDSGTTGVNSTPDESASSAGAAYVFVRSGTAWSQKAYLKPHQVTTYDQFGHAVAVSGDTVVVGAYGEDSSTTGVSVNGTPNESADLAGAAYVFVRSGTMWTQQAYLKASQVTAGDIFGYSVAVSGDTVVVGANYEDSSTTGVSSTPNDSAANPGAAYVFVRSGTTWTQQAYLKASQVSADDNFGFSVAVSGDTVVVGANQEDSSTTGVNSTANELASNSGAVYAFAGLGVATVTTPTSASSAATSATLGGNVISDGGATITARGIVYAQTATNNNPQIGGTGVTNIVGSGTTGVFTVTASGLTATTTYTYAAYATTSAGTTYSSTGTFTTLNSALTLAAIALSGTEDTTLTFTAANFTGAYTHVDSTALVSITVATLPPTGMLKLSGTDVTASQVIPRANLANLTYVPAANENGAKTFTVTASDGTASSAAATVTMTLTAVNDAPSFALPVGAVGFDAATWTARESNRVWFAIASSADGTKLAAVVDGGQIYTSTDSGATWTARESNRVWRSIASSADGTKLAAVVNAGQIYTSTDSGVTWTARESNRVWRSIASSADGTKLAAGVGNGGLIYTSTDSGVTWTPRGSSRGWYGIASSEDGTKLAAAAYGSQIYTSTDSGVTWTERLSDANRSWYGIASSADGTKLAAVVANGQIYTSADSGLNWTARESNRFWFSIASSSDGSKLAAVVLNGQIYTSIDSGATWLAAASGTRNWVSVGSSADGTKLAAVPNGGQIYTSTAALSPYLVTMAEDAGAQTQSGFATSVSAGPTDESAQTLSFTVTNTNNALFSAQPALNASGTLTFTPAANASGTATVTVTAQDTGGTANGGVATSAAQTFTLTVTAVNDAPTLAAIALSGTKDTTFTFTAANFTGAYADVENTPLASITVATLPATGLLKLSGTNVTASQVIALADLPNLTYVPAANETGAKTFTVTASEGAISSAAATVTLTLNATNVAPTLAAIAVSGTEDTTLTFTAANFTGAYADEESSPLASITVATLPATGLLKLSGANVTASQVITVINLPNLTYVPAANENGAMTFTVTASDGGRSSAAATVTMTLTAVNDAPSFAIPAGTTGSAAARWTARASTAVWFAIASSADGTKLAAVVDGGQIYTSTDSGTNWTARESNRVWRAIASSADGTKLAAVAQNGQIYTSTDSGVTWTARESNRDWRSIASSADGTKLAAGVNNGQIYTSTDSGVTWTARGSNRGWYAIASSADGTKLAAVAYSGQIYTSTDSGATWTARESNRGWYGIASSADGTKLAAVVGNGLIYTSTDSGATWTARESNRFWFSIASSADGAKLAAVVLSGQIYTSIDSGATWTAQAAGTPPWCSIASSADGTKLAAVPNGGQIYILAIPYVLTVLEDAGAQSQSGVATGISTGPANEAAQTVAFTATNTNNALFSAQPAIDAGGTLTFTPAANANGTATVTVTVQDNGGTAIGGVATSVAQTFTITVTGVIDAPTLAAIAVNGTEDTTLAFTAANFTGAYTHAESTALVSFTVATLPATGTLKLSGTDVTVNQVIPAANLGNLTYVPAANENGVKTFTVTASDGTLSSAAATVTMTLAAVNDAPTITDIGDTSIVEDSATSGLAFTLGDVETAVDSLTVTAISSNTTLIPNANLVFGGTGASRTLTATPKLNQFGAATITVTVNDGTTTTSDTFGLTVTAVNDAPTLAAIADPTAILEDANAQTVILTGIAAGGGETQLLMVTATSSNPGLIPNPTVTYTSAGPTGSLSYTPVANANGTALITVTVTDNGGTDNSGVATTTRTFTVAVTAVNDAPTITDIADTSIAEDGATGALAFTIGDLETAVDSLTVTATSSNTTLIPNANLVFGGTGVARTLTATPAANQFGASTISVIVSDGATTTSDTFLLTVTAVNDAPVLTTVSTLTGATEDTALTISYATLLAAANAADADGDTLSFRVEMVSTGTLTKGGVAAIGGTLLSSGQDLVWTPPANANGTLNAFTIKMWDGTTTSASAIQVQVTVTATNDAPVAIADVHTTNEDTPLVVSLGSPVVDQQQTAWNTGLPYNGYQTFTAGQTGFLTSINLIQNGGESNPQQVTLTLYAGDGISGAGLGQVTISETNTYNSTLGGYAQTYTFSQPIAIVSGGVYTLNVLSSSNRGLLGSSNTNAYSNGRFYQSAGYTGDLWFRTSVATSQGLLVNDSDAEGDSLAAVVVTNPSNGTVALNSDGKFTYTPNANFHGTDAFNYKAYDGTSFSNVATATVNVAAVNDAPTANAQTIAPTEDTTYSDTLTASDVDSTALTYTVVSQGTKGVVTIPNAATGAFTYVPDANANGSDSFTYKANDGSLDSAPAIVTVNIAAVNDAPTLTAVSTLTGATEDTALTISYAALAAAADAADVDGDTLSFRVEAVSTGTLTKGGVAVVAGTTLLGTGESLVWTPAANANGTLNAFTIKAWDGALNSATAIQVQVTVAAVNDAPTLAAIAVSGTEDTTLAFTAANFTGAYSDVESTGLVSITVATLPATGLLKLSGTDVTASQVIAAADLPNLSYVPAANENGAKTFTVTASDGTASSAAATVMMTLAAVNDAPVITSNGGGATAAINVAENTTAVTTVVATDADLPAQGITYSITGGADSAQFSVVAATGVLTFATAPNFEVPTDVGANNVYDLIVTATDDGSPVGTKTQSIAVTVTNANEAPVITGNSVSIPDGDNTPSTTDHTDFGSALVSGGTVVRTFTIANNGTGSLTLSGTPLVAVSGTHAADFTVTALPASPVTASGSTTFQVTFTPSGSGTRSATLTLANDDSVVGSYDFAIQGTGVSPFATWQTLNGASGTTAADHDNDGVSDGIEYFVGGPSGNTTGQTTLPSIINNSGTLSITWIKGTGYPGVYGSDYLIETTDTLTGTWTPETLGVNITLTGSNVIYTFPAASGNRRFVRLKVMAP
jgi:VCBS repeat-containing protein